MKMIKSRMFGRIVSMIWFRRGECYHRRERGRPGENPSSPLGHTHLVGEIVRSMIDRL